MGLPDRAHVDNSCGLLVSITTYLQPTMPLYATQLNAPELKPLTATHAPQQPGPDATITHVGSWLGTPSQA